jgi:hypothetical protein
MTEDQVTDQDVDLHDDDEEIMEAKHGKKVNENPALQGMLQKSLASKPKKKKLGAQKDHDQEVEEQADEDDSVPVATKPAPKRTGDKGTQDPMPKTKAALMAAMMTKLQAMNKTDLQAMYNMESFESEDGEIVVEAPKADIAYEANFEDDLNALVSEEATLSDEFKGKAATIFEAAIKSKLSAEVDRLEEKYNEELAEEVASTKADMIEKIDSYLNYVVEQWIEDNKVAVQAGLRTEIAEKFMNNLKGLFVESYIDVPESKVDLVDELAQEVAELEETTNSQTSKIIEMTEELENYKRDEVIREASNGLAQTQIEKLKSLVADIDFSDNFAEKVATVKESYFKNEAVDKSADAEQIEETFEVETSDAMGQYLNAIKRQNKS